MNFDLKCQDPIQNDQIQGRKMEWWVSAMKFCHKLQITKKLWIKEFVCV
jgi:hypothetical protein